MAFLGTPSRTLSPSESRRSQGTLPEPALATSHEQESFVLVWVVGESMPNECQDSAEYMPVTACGAAPHAHEPRISYCEERSHSNESLHRNRHPSAARSASMEPLALARRDRARRDVAARWPRGPARGGSC